MRQIVHGLAVATAAVAFAAPVQAEVVTVHPSGFVVRHEVAVAADSKSVWLALIAPDTWWRKEHTWSGDAANLSLQPTAGGCFCERIPEIDEPGRFTLEGSVEHMRVIQSQPEAALRLRGGLGPLQSEPVNGVLTIAISRIAGGTRLVWEYNVAGYMRYEIPVIAKAVDGVITLQAEALADLLGRADLPAAPTPKTKAPADVEKPSGSAPASAPAKQDAAVKPKAKLDEAFGDLIAD